MADDAVGTQLILAAATMPTNAADLLQTVVDPSTVHEVVGTRLHRMQPHIEQRFVRMNKTGRPVQLLRVVRDEMARRRPVIVFCNKSATSDYVSMFLNENGVGCANLNGDMPAALRAGTFERFQAGEVDVLSTTDMASRGLDTTRVRQTLKCLLNVYLTDSLCFNSFTGPPCDQLRCAAAHGRLHPSHRTHWPIGQRCCGSQYCDELCVECARD